MIGRKLRFDKILFHWIRSWNEPKVDWSKIDYSCLIFSDKPVENKGWIKGWVNGKDEILVTKHANPVVGDYVHVVLNGNKIQRRIISIDPTYTHHDIAICKLNLPWPDGVKIYKIAKSVEKMQLICSFHQNMTYSTRRVLMDEYTLIGTYYDRDFVAGDSGLPWFVWEDNEFKVCSHSWKGMWGIGPNYSKILA